MRIFSLNFEIKLDPIIHFRLFYKIYIFFKYIKIIKKFVKKIDH